MGTNITGNKSACLKKGRYGAEMVNQAKDGAPERTGLTAGWGAIGLQNGSPTFLLL